jgi:hypothetical protein
MNITFNELKCDMPVRWNSTDELLKAAIKMERPIRAVLYSQTWDDSVHQNLTPTDTDWALFRELAIFFNIFRRPTVQSQAERYPTLHNTIPNYLHMIRMLNVWQLQDDKPFLKAAAIAGHTVLTKYYKKALTTRHSFVAIICDPRYKLEVLSYLFEADGGVNAVQYKRGKAHFEHVYSDYKRRANGLADLERRRLEDAARDAQDRQRSPSPEEEGQEDWRNNPYHGYADHVARQRQHAPELGLITEWERWYREPVLDIEITHEEMRDYMQSKAHEFPIITQMARDYLAIPATSAPSERVFSAAGNLITKRRTRISSENVRYVLCLRSWGLLVDDDDEVDIMINEGGEIVPIPVHVHVPN